MAAAVPLWNKSVEHIDAKIDQAKQSGQTVTVWLLDGTTGAYLAIVLAVLLVGGVLYEALPTAKWGGARWARSSSGSGCWASSRTT
ncbi:hypothetical protein GCM10020000_50600 [Streptomyces olivoverticillatus]